MQLNSFESMFLQIKKTFELFYGDLVKGFCLEDSYINGGTECLSIEFTAYDFFRVLMEIEGTDVMFWIMYQNSKVPLHLTNNQWEASEKNELLFELKEELESRIPEQFLKKDKVGK